jgi:uncharacterized protein YdeI (BOF family)
MTEPTGNSRKSILGLGTAVLFCAAMAFTPGVTPRVHAAPATVAKAAGTDDAAAVQTFTGKIMSQNGDRFILRDDTNDTWYHLDPQDAAGKFLGKNVQITGTLDGRSDMIHVRNIAENKTENHN